MKETQICATYIFTLKYEHDGTIQKVIEELEEEPDIVSAGGAVVVYNEAYPYELSLVRAMVCEI